MLVRKNNHLFLFLHGGGRGGSMILPLLICAFIAILFLAALSQLRASWQTEEPLMNLEACNLFSGRWVYDNSTGPLYSGLQCSSMNDEIACEKYGRRDLKYQWWRWKPHGCNLPRFDGRKLLEKLRGKRMVYVGDSLNRNQWVSMVCLLESSMYASDRKSMTTNGSLMSFKAEEYNATIDFYWSPLLVESNCDNPMNHRVSNRVMRAQSIEKHAEHWMDAEYIVFNTYLWWKKPRMKMKVLQGSFDEKNKTYMEVEMIYGFQLALEAWSNWLQEHKDTMKAKLFFVSLSPTHVWGEDWGTANGQNCYNETNPITREGHTGRGSDYRMMRMLDIVLRRLKNRGVRVNLLNITQLSEYRKDGHPSIYRKWWDHLSENQLVNPSSYADCTHWCLPGVPDVWNQLLYAYIISK